MIRLLRSMSVPCVFLAFLFLAAPELSSGAQITPYLQSPTSTSMYICWQSTSDTLSHVQYGTTATLGTTATGSSDRLGATAIWHTVKLTGLQPNTVYFYQCSSETDLSGYFKFKTPPADGTPTGHIRFGITSDTQSLPAVHRETTDSMKASMIRLFGSDLENQVSLIIHSGDIVSDGSILSQYKDIYLDPLASLSPTVPSMISIGNHEGENPYFYRYMHFEDFGGPQGEKYYSFRIGRVRFVALNVNIAGATQLSWFESTLQQAEADSTIDWVFGFWHHPGHSEVWPDGNTAYTQDQLQPILAKYSKVTMLMHGHTHAYERGALTDVPVRTVICSGGGSSLDRWRAYGNQHDYPEIERSYDHYCYGIVDIDIAAKSYTFRGYSLGNNESAGSPGKRLNNILIDTFTQSKTAAPPAKPAAVPVTDSVRLPVLLNGGPYSGSRPFLSSQFQVTAAAGDYSTPLLDVKRDVEDIYYDTGAPNYTPIDQNAGVDITIDTLKPSANFPAGQYYWRVRYRNDNLDWSQWSDEQPLFIKDSGIPHVVTHNRALDLDGTGTYIEVTNNLAGAVMPTRDMTVEAWVNLRAISYWGGIVGAFQDNGGYEKGWCLGNVGQSFCFGLATKGVSDGDGVMTYMYPSQTFGLNQWYHVAATYNGSVMKLYVNGTLVTSSTAQNGDILYDPNSFFDIGNYHDANEFAVLNGMIDDVKLWNVELSQAEIRAWMHKELTSAHPRYQNLVSYWNLNDTAGTVARDVKNQNQGTLIGIKGVNRVPSSAPVGSDGAFDNTKTAISVGADGAQLVATMTSNPSSQDFLGVYLSGSPTGLPVGSEAMPPGIAERTDFIWGIREFGSVIADANLFYSALPQLPPADSLHLLQRSDVFNEWTDVTDQYFHDPSLKKFELPGMYEYGEFTLAWPERLTGVAEQNQNTHPLRTRLYPNYPNPFNPETQIRFDIAKQSAVSLAIYNVLGQKVRSLFEGTRAPGSYTVAWNGKNDHQSPLPSGVYFCTLAAGNSTTAIKLLMVR